MEKKKVSQQEFYANRKEIIFYENHELSTIINESIV